MGTTGKRARRRQKAQEWLEKGDSHPEQKKNTEMDSEVDSEVESHEVMFPSEKTQKVLEVPECTVGSVTHMVKTLNDAIVAVSKDTAMIQHAYQQLYKDNVARDKALEDLTAMVKEYGESPSATRPYGPPTPKINTDVLDSEGNLRAADIGITWANNETFLHGVRVVGSKIPGPTGHEPIMSTPYPERGDYRIRSGDSHSYSSGGRTDSSSGSRTSSGIPSGGTDPAIQQQVVELAGMVPSFPECCRRAWMVKGTASPTAGVIPRRDCNERGAGAGRQ